MGAPWNSLRVLLLVGVVAAITQACYDPHQVPAADGAIVEGELPLGASCSLNLDCASGLCIPGDIDGVATGWPEGMCSRDCVDAAEACAGTETCVELLGDAYCLPSCEGNEECRAEDGYICHQLLGACFPDCASIGCPPGVLCYEDGHCRPPAATGSRPIGEACFAHALCESGFCLRAVDDEGQATGWVEGTCTRACPDEGCGDGQACVVLDETPLCLASCDSASGPNVSRCRPGYVCSQGHGACLPDCHGGWPCPSGTSCRSSGLCR
jgi:hypothetical protein